MRHWSKTMTIWDRYGSLVKTNSGTTDSQRQFILRSHTQTHTLPLCEIIRLQAEVACVLCGCRCDLVGLCYGLKEPGDTEEASPQRGLLQGLHFPDRLTPASHVLEYVLLCPLFISNQFLHPSIPPVLLPPTILPFLPPPSPSIPLFHWESYRSSPRPNQFSSESSPVSRGPRLQHWNYLSTYFISHHTHTAPAHTHHLHSLSEYALHVQSTRTFFFFSVYLHSPQLHSPTSFWSGCWCFLSGGGVSGRESWSSVSINENCFSEVSPFLSALCRSLQLLGIHTNSVDVQGSVWGGGRRCGGGWMKGGGGGGRSAVIWRVVRGVNTAVLQLQNPIRVHQESYFILNLTPLLTLFLTPQYYLFLFLMMWTLPYCSFQEIRSVKSGVTHILCTWLAIQAMCNSLFKVLNKQTQQWKSWEPQSWDPIHINW